jgi:hypothetical protein
MDLKGKLIAAARAERMPPTSRRRALGVAAGIGVTKVAPASAAGHALVGGALGKWVAIVAGTAVLGATVYGVASRAVRTPPAPQATHWLEDVPRPLEPSPTATPARTEVTEPPAPPQLSVSPARPQPPPRPVSSASIRARAPDPSPLAPRPLAAEIAALDVAKRALASGDAPGAMRDLDDYDRAFAHGALLPEAQALRIEALARSGRRAEARARLDAFRAEHPDSPLLEALSLIAR